MPRAMAITQPRVRIIRVVVGRFGYGDGVCVFGARGGGGVAVGHGVKSVISGYVVAYLLAAVGNVAANGAYADGFGRDCG